MNEIWKNIKDYENLYQVSNLGNVRSITHKRKNGKKENQYDMNGEFIQQWNCIMDAERFLNKKRANVSICSCCKNKTKSAYGYIWKYGE